MHANKRIDIKQASVGDIVAIPGLKYVTTGDTLCKKISSNNCDDTILLDNISFPQPVISISINPKNKSEQEKLINATKRISEEDPSIKISIDDNDGNIIVSGMGELHLEVFFGKNF